jgi:hypothetical protein
MSVHDVVTRFSTVGVQQVVAENQRIISSLNQVQQQGITSGQSVQQLSREMKDNLAATYAMRRGYSGIRMAVRTAYAPMLETARLMSTVGSLGRQGLSAWQAYEVGMIRVSQAESGYADATKDLAFWQDKANQYLVEFGADSSYYREASQKVADTKAKVDEMNQSIAAAKNEMTLFWAAMAFKVPDAIASLIKINAQFAILKETLAVASMGGPAASMSGGLTGMGVSLASGLGVGVNSSLAAAGVAVGVPAVVAAGFVGGAVGFGLQQQQRQDAAYLAALADTASKGSNVTFPSWATDAMIQAAFKQNSVNAYNSRKSTNISPSLGMTKEAYDRIMQITVNQTNNITNEADARAAGDAAYREFIKKLGDITGG